MRRSELQRRCRAVGAIVWCIVLAVSAAAAAQEPPPPLRVVVSTSGRPAFDSLLDTMASRAGLAGQFTVRYADPLQAMRDLCRNPGGTDVVLATQPMQSSLAAECGKNGVDVAAVELARSAMILTVRTGSELTGLTSRQIYLAIAREVPYKEEFTRNTAVRWADVDPALPPQDIRFQLPMRDEGSRATFDAMVLQGGCRNEPAVRQVFDAQQRTARCITMRSDRVRELPRAQSVKGLLEAPVGTVGVLSQREIALSNGELVGLALDGITPSPAQIGSGIYDFSTSFWLYAKRGAHDVDRILVEAADDAIIGPNGPLRALGLVALPEDERESQRTALAAATGIGSLRDWLTATAADAWHMFFAAREPMPSGMAMDFTGLMDIAGYHINGVQSSIGIIPDASMTFGMAREMSDADRLYLERILYRDSLARPGAIAAMQRRIIRSIESARELGEFAVSKVEVDFLPLPKVALTVTPEGSAPTSAPRANPNPRDTE